MRLYDMLRYVVVATVIAGAAQAGWAADLGSRSATIWQYEEWQVNNPSWDGNAFDVVATVTATHTSGAKREFEMFYDGGTTWKFRFTGDIVGDWSLTTGSGDADLNGHTASVSVAAGDPDALGFSTGHGNKYAWQVGNDGELRGQIRRVYTDQRCWFWGKQNGPSDNLNGYFKPQLDDAVAYGFDAVWICFRHAWFKWGIWAGAEHNNENPDLTVFRMLENYIQQVHGRGLSLDIRMWGDQGHDWSAASLPGGINGYVDRRLQRYIAARLGALPGWGLSYGYDLEEFMDNGKCDAWADYLNERFAWPHLIWTRRYYDGISVTVASNDDRPGSADNAYGDARNRLNGSGNRPVLFERNFNRGRDGVWDDNTTLQSLWAFVMAGGASAHWTSEKYEPEWQNRDQLKTHGRFWVDNKRFLLDMEPHNELGGSNTWVLVSESSRSLVAYRRGTNEITVDLSGFSGPLPAIAVDTRNSYAEIDLGMVSAENHTFNLGSSSDWAVAVGSFGDQSPPVDDTPPSAPSNLAATAAGNSQIDLTWDAASDDQSGIGGYNIYRGGEKIGTSDNTSYSDQGLEESSEYTYRVSAVNGVGLEGGKSAEASATTSGPDPDDTPPSAPSNLAATAAGNSQIDLTWDAASDDQSGIGGYNIYRDGEKVGTSDNTSYSDEGLGEGTTYKYRVSAVNGEGLEGGKSAEVSATTSGPDPDDTPPSAPANLTATAAGKTQIDLSWDAASDDQSGIGGYNIYRDGEKVGTSDNTSYSDEGLGEGTTYKYRVSAVNGEGLEGEKSPEASATTEAENDTSPPALASVNAQSATSVMVRFNETVTRESAENTDNYEINGGITVDAAVLEEDNLSVVLTTSALAEKTTYSLTVSNIVDRSPNANTGGGQMEFMLSGEVQITNVTVASGKTYEIVEAIAEGDEQFIDRGFTWESLGDFAGMAYIRTANDDKSESGESFLSFAVNRKATVYVAYRHDTDLPPWLSSWSATGEQVCGDGCSEVYKKDFDAGTVTLGGNMPGGAGNMYTVFVGAGGDATALAQSSADHTAGVAPVRARFNGRTLRVSGLYPDRDYAFTLTDARGRVRRFRRSVGPGGVASLSVENGSAGGVYVVAVLSAQHRCTLKLVMP